MTTDSAALRAPAAILCLLVVTACGDGGGDDGVAPTVISPLASNGTTAPETPFAPDDTPTLNAPEETVVASPAPDDVTDPDGSLTDPEDTPEPDEPDEPSVPDDDGPAPLALDGEWLLTCRERDPEASDGVHAVTTLTIAGNTTALRELAYADDTCSVPATPAEFVVDVAIAFPGGTTDTSLGVATNIDLTVGEPTFDGAELDAADLEVLASIGFFDTRYDIALIDGAELYFGDFESDPARDGTAPERRPDRLDLLPFVRQ